VENGKWRVENGKWRVESGEWKILAVIGYAHQYLTTLYGFADLESKSNNGGKK
jgi:hypothetical protein